MGQGKASLRTDVPARGLDESGAARPYDPPGDPMTTRPHATLIDPPMPVRARLAAAWTSLMFLYAYVDILNFYRPGTVDDILDGIVWEFAISQAWAATALGLMAVPILMIVLSMTLPAQAARVANLVVASVQIPFAAFNVVGESWTLFYGLGFVAEAGLLLFILRCSWTWPRAGVPAARESVRTAARA